MIVISLVGYPQLTTMKSYTLVDLLTTGKHLGQSPDMPWSYGCTCNINFKDLQDLPKNCTAFS